MKAGSTSFVPANENSGQSIASVTKWDQAFRVYSDIYCKAHPARSTELIQYSHVIHTASATYVWENVYLYDKDFRMHLNDNPGRSWAIILQQAWAMRLKDKIKTSDSFYKHGNENADSAKFNPNRCCKRFNKGRCTFGSRCRFEHHCTYCFKFGHGFHNCRKRAADYKERESNKQNGGHHQNAPNLPMITDGKASK